MVHWVQENSYLIIFSFSQVCTTGAIYTLMCPYQTTVVFQVCTAVYQIGFIYNKLSGEFVWNPKSVCFVWPFWKYFAYPSRVSLGLYAIEDGRIIDQKGMWLTHTNLYLVLIFSASAWGVCHEQSPGWLFRNASLQNLRFHRWAD